MNVEVQNVTGVFAVAVETVEIHTDEHFVGGSVVPLYQNVALLDDFVVDILGADFFTGALGVLLVVILSVGLVVIFVNEIAFLVEVRISEQVRLYLETEVAALQGFGIEGVDIEFHSHIVSRGGNHFGIEILPEIGDTAGDPVYGLILGGGILVEGVGGVVVYVILAALDGFGKFAGGKSERHHNKRRHEKQ